MPDAEEGSVEKKAEEGGEQKDGEEKKDEAMPDAGAEAAGEKKESEGADSESKPKAEEKKEEKKEEPKKPKYEWVEVRKMKKRTKRTQLSIDQTGVPGLSAKEMQTFKDVESRLITDTKEVKENDARRNELESYIYKSRDRVATEGGECAEYMKKDDRENFASELMKYEDWLYDHFDASTLELQDKLIELQNIGEPVIKRKTLRDAALEKMPQLEQAVRDARALASNPSEDYAHIDEEKKNSVLVAADGMEQWCAQMSQKIAATPLHEKLEVTAKDMQEKVEIIKDMAHKVMSEPKPAPPTPEPEEESKEESKEGEEAAPQEGDHAEEKPTSDEAPAETEV